MDKINKTKDIYGYIWEKTKDSISLEESHYFKVQQVIGHTIVRGTKGIEVGSGCGYDTYFMAKNNSAIKIASLDISDGVYRTKEITSGLKNVLLMKGSALAIPVKDNIFDFAYSFGVLHHTSDPEKGLMEIRRVIKDGAPVYLYLYEDHSENPLKYLAIKVTNILRCITTRLPSTILYVISCMVSPFVVLFFSYPAKILKNFKLTRQLSEKIPFNFGKGLFSLRGDLFDRFGAPIEYRYSRNGAIELLKKCGFDNISITRLLGLAGWVVFGFKRGALDA